MQLCVGHGKTYPDDVRPLYPRLLSRLGHTRLNSVVDGLFPRAAWTDRAFRRLADTDFDVIHVHNFHGDYASVESLGWLARRKPVVWTFHAFWGITGGCDHPRDCARFNQACGDCPQLGVWPIGPRDDTSEQLQRKKACLSDAPLRIVAPSQFLAGTVKTSLVGRRWPVHHIPNGIDPSRFSGTRKADLGFRAGLGLRPGKTAILVVNREFRDPNKGFPMVREALAAGIPPEYQVVLVGRNSAWAAAQLPAELDVLDAGFVADRAALAGWYEAADIFLFASQAENFPCVVLEAMASECCVVATPTGGVREQVETGVSGVLADAISGPALATTLKAVVGDAAMRRELGARARDRTEVLFGEDRMIEAHVALYRSILATPGAN